MFHVLELPDSELPLLIFEFPQLFLLISELPLLELPLCETTGCCLSAWDEVFIGGGVVERFWWWWGWGWWWGWWSGWG